MKTPRLRIYPARGRSCGKIALVLLVLALIALRDLAHH
jgi:hypothetical protein